MKGVSWHSLDIYYIIKCLLDRIYLWKTGYGWNIETKGESYAMSTDEKSLVLITKVIRCFWKWWEIEMKYTVPFICPQAHFADQALLSFNEVGQ